MKILITLILGVLLIFSSILADTETSQRFHSSQKHSYHFDYDEINNNDISIGYSHFTDFDFDNNDLIIENHTRRYDDEVRITSEYDLFVNGKHIKTDASQRKLLKKFYVRAEEMTESAKIVGLEGGRIGVAGAKLGLHAVGGLFKTLGSEYDMDDLEDELEEQADLLEEQAEELEKEAEELEDMADELEDLSEELIENIPELQELEWF